MVEKQIWGKDWQEVSYAADTSISRGIFLFEVTWVLFDVVRRESRGLTVRDSSDHRDRRTWTEVGVDGADGNGCRSGHEDRNDQVQTLRRRKRCSSRRSSARSYWKATSVVGWAMAERPSVPTVLAMANRMDVLHRSVGLPTVLKDVLVIVVVWDHRDNYWKRPPKSSPLSIPSPSASIVLPLSSLRRFYPDVYSRCVSWRTRDLWISCHSTGTTIYLCPLLDSWHWWTSPLRPVRSSLPILPLLRRPIDRESQSMASNGLRTDGWNSSVHSRWSRTGLSLARESLHSDWASNLLERIQCRCSSPRNERRVSRESNDPTPKERWRDWRLVIGLRLLCSVLCPPRMYSRDVLNLPREVPLPLHRLLRPDVQWCSSARDCDWRIQWVSCSSSVRRSSRRWKKKSPSRPSESRYSSSRRSRDRWSPRCSIVHPTAWWSSWSSADRCERPSCVAQCHWWYGFDSSARDWWSPPCPDRATRRGREIRWDEENRERETTLVEFSS